MELNTLPTSNARSQEHTTRELMRARFAERLSPRLNRIRTYASSGEESAKRELFLELSGLASTARTLGYADLSALAARSADRCSEAVRRGVAGSSSIELRLLISAVETRLTDIRNAALRAA